MKVLQINSVCGRGSTGRIVLDIHNALIEQGHKSLVAYGREPAIGCENAIRIGTKKDIYAHGLYTRIFDKHGLGSQKATRQFIKNIEAESPDIIHLHNIHGYYLNYEILFRFLKNFGKPVIWTFHDCWPFTGHCAYFTYAGCERWQKVCHDCPQKRSYPGSLVFDNSRRNFERKREAFTGVKDLTIITPSKWLAGLVKQSFLSEYETVVISNGIDTTVFRPLPSDFKSRHAIEDKFMILGVANVWDQRKGLKYFLELADILENDEIIVLVGLTKKQVESLPANIIGITRTNNIQELVEIYSAADVFVNPTLEDNYPTVNLEAQACGTYVVTFDSGGTRETIIDSSHGTICGEKTTQALRKILSDLKQYMAIDDLKRQILAKKGELVLKIDRKIASDNLLTLYGHKCKKIG